MEPTVTIYDSHWPALDAIEMLKNKSYPVNQISLLGRVKIIDKYMKIKLEGSTKITSESLCVVLDSTSKVLARVSVFAIPGHGLFIGAGAVKQVLDDIDMGKGINEIFSILTAIGIKKDEILKCGDDLIKGKYLVIAQGNNEEVKNAKTILSDNIKHLDLSKHFFIYKNSNQIYSNYNY